MAKYDEDLHDNPFFIILTDKYHDLFAVAAENCWVICVPRVESLARLKLHRVDFENHILIPDKPAKDTPTDDDNHFITFNGKCLSLCGEVITTGSGFKEERQVKILFDESFFNSKDQSYQILCIDQLLEGGSEERAVTILALETFEDCKAFLWNDPTSDKVKKAVDALILSSARATSFDINPDSIKDTAYSIYERAMTEASRMTHIRKLQNATGKNFFSLATETYVLNKLYPLFFMSLCKCDLGDSDINKATRKMCDVQLLDLGIRPDFFSGLAKARKCLLSLNKCSSPFEKIRCFKQTVGVLASLVGASREALTADELLPMLVYLVLTSEIPNWRSNMHYIRQFHFSEVGSEEVQYYLASFEAAIEYITTGSLEKNLGSVIEKARLPASDESLKSKRLSSFFESISGNDIELLEKLLTELLKIPDEISQTLCHPLCDCEKCSIVVQRYYDNPAYVGVHSTDRLNRTGLHYAAISGHESIVQKLLEKKEFKMEIDGIDINGYTPLHLACLHGNQKCVLYLLSEGANINKTDKHGNTPLHLACSHGHEECVKALVFHKEKCSVNVINELCDTPLHLAARWNYVPITLLLLEHGADRSAKNSNGDTPLQSTYSGKIRILLRPPSRSLASLSAATKEMSEAASNSSRGAGTEVRLRNSESFVGGATRSVQKNKRRSSTLSNVSNETDRQIKKLFRAIHDQDITMVKYLFGAREVPSQQGEANDLGGASEPCHPLCQCEKCSKLKKGSQQPMYLSVHTYDSRGHTPLHEAALHGGRFIVSYLIELGAPKNARTKDELVTPLHLACQYNHKDVVMILLENGADVNPREIRGNTPLHFSCNNGHMDSSAILMIHGADVTASNDRGDTPLHNAARWNHAYLVRELILYGAQYSCRNNEDKTPDDLTTDDEVHQVIQMAMAGEITTGEYAPLHQPDSPGISDDDEFQHV